MVISPKSFQVEGKKLFFGSWTVELRDDELADVKFENHLVLRSLRTVVRDADWNTAVMSVENILVSPGGITFDILSKSFGANLIGTVEFTVSGSTAEYVIDLQSETNFKSNRAGIVVLHSPEDAGSEVQVTDTEGIIHENFFPVEIVPDQPLENVKSMRWTRAGVETNLDFTGEIFETEDQRNWTDASFKTYSRPLSFPFPFLISAKEKIQQSVKISLSGNPDHQVAEELILDLDSRVRAPDFSLMSSNAKESNHIYAPIGSSVLLELDLGAPNCIAAAVRAKKSGLPIHLRLILSGEHGSEQISQILRELSDCDIKSVAAFDSKQHVSTRRTQDILVEAVRNQRKHIGMVAGSRSHFTELNRNRDFPRENLSAVCFSSTPLFHSSDTSQLIESLPMQRLNAVNAVKIADGIPLHVGPITLRPRFNNVATGKQPMPTRADLEDGYGAEFTSVQDERQFSVELGAWSIAAFCAFAIKGVESITWFEEWGPRGVVDSTGKPYPVHEAMLILAKLAGKEILVSSSPNNQVWAIAVRKLNSFWVLASNMAPVSKQFVVKLDGIAKIISLEGYSFGSFEI